MSASPASTCASGIDAKGILTYLVSAHYSAAVLVPDALGILENIEIAR